LLKLSCPLRAVNRGKIAFGHGRQTEMKSSAILKSFGRSLQGESQRGKTGEDENRESGESDHGWAFWVGKFSFDENILTQKPNIAHRGYTLVCTGMIPYPRNAANSIGVLA
jgi:hypothetical protein